MRVLVVEDERLLGKAIATALGAGLQAEVDLAYDGPSALKLAEEHTYALAVVDFSVPPPTGLALLERWRDDARMGPIVMMSGTYKGSERSLALAAGASLYIEKPFSLIDLVAEARTLLQSGDRG